MMIARSVAAEEAYAGWLAQRRVWEDADAKSTVLGDITFPDPAKKNKIDIGAVANRLERTFPHAFRALSLRLPLELTHVSFAYPDLPEDLVGYRILHLTDSHLDGSPQAMARIAKVIDGVNADIVIMTGDYVSRHFARDIGPAAVRQMAQLAALVTPRDGSFATLGNHDYGDMGRLFEQAGVCFLANESMMIKRGRATIYLTGIDDTYRFYTSAASAALKKPKGDVQEFRLLAAHTCEMADEAAAVGYRLGLYGHTHGGQVCLTPGQPLHVLLNKHKELASGRHQVGAMIHYTGRGIGSALPLRINCTAEVTLMTLTR